MFTPARSLLTGRSLAVDFSAVSAAPSSKDSAPLSYFEAMAARRCPPGTDPVFFTVKPPHQHRREAVTVAG